MVAALAAKDDQDQTGLVIGTAIGTVLAFACVVGAMSEGGEGIYAGAFSVAIFWLPLVLVCATFLVNSESDNTGVSANATAATGPRAGSKNLPAIWKNPIERNIKCREYAHHWTSAFLYVGSRRLIECDDGKRLSLDCHGAGMAVGAYSYDEGYSGWDQLPAKGATYSMVCAGLDLVWAWNLGGFAHGCGIWKGNDQIGAYLATPRGGGLNFRGPVWGYRCTVDLVDEDDGVDATGMASISTIGVGVVAAVVVLFTIVINSDGQM